MIIAQNKKGLSVVDSPLRFWLLWFLTHHILGCPCVFRSSIRIRNRPVSRTAIRRMLAEIIWSTALQKFCNHYKGGQNDPVQCQIHVAPATDFFSVANRRPFVHWRLCTTVVVCLWCALYKTIQWMSCRRRSCLPFSRTRKESDSRQRDQRKSFKLGKQDQR